MPILRKARAWNAVLLFVILFSGLFLLLYLEMGWFDRGNQLMLVICVSFSKDQTSCLIILLPMGRCLAILCLGRAREYGREKTGGVDLCTSHDCMMSARSTHTSQHAFPLHLFDSDTWG